MPHFPAMGSEMGVMQIQMTVQNFTTAFMEMQQVEVVIREKYLTLGHVFQNPSQGEVVKLIILAIIYDS